MLTDQKSAVKSAVPCPEMIAFKPKEREMLKCCNQQEKILYFKMVEEMCKKGLQAQARRKESYKALEVQSECDK